MREVITGETLDDEVKTQDEVDHIMIHVCKKRDDSKPERGIVAVVGF